MIYTLDQETLRHHQHNNLTHTVLLLAGMGAVLAVTAYLLWGLVGLAFIFIVVGLITAFSQRVPPELLMKLYSAVPLPPDRSQLSQIVDELSNRAQLPTRPNLYVIPSATLNAFAAGTPNNPAIAITEGLFRQLTMREIVGVLAHEISHIRNNDTWVMGVADLLSRLVQPLFYVAIAITFINLLGTLTGEPPMSWTGVLLLYLAPAISSLMQLGLSRTREYDADVEAVMLTGDPMGLASALRRLDNETGRFWEDLALPVPTRKVPQPSLLRTHPPTQERVNRILALSKNNSTPPIIVADEPMISVVSFGPSELRPRYRWPGVWY